MRLRGFSLLTDQNIHPDVAAWLRSESFDVLEVDQAGLTGASDIEVLERALVEGRAVVTHDGDFGSMAVPQGASFVGILYLRPGHLKPQQTIDGIQQLLDADPDLHPPFIVVVKQSSTGIAIRIRQTTP